jgi:hypothetical protein
MENKFSDIYIKNINIKEYISVDIVKEYKKTEVIKELLPNNKLLYYLWGNIGYSLLFDYNCKMNEKIMKIKDQCFYIENKIKQGDLEIIIYDIKNVLLPLLDSLTLDEIKLMINAHRISCGPLYKQLIDITTPEIFINLFN